MSHKTCRWKYLRLVLVLITGWVLLVLDVITGWFRWSDYRLVLLVLDLITGWVLLVLDLITGWVLLVLDVITGWFCWYTRSGSDWIYSWNTQNSPCLCNNLSRCSASQGHRWGHTPAQTTEPPDWSWAAGPEASNTPSPDLNSPV